MSKIRLVIFDLDGTLLDTLSDLAHCANFALKQNGFTAHPIEAYKYFVGNGVLKLFERALPENEKTPENIERLRAVFFPYYELHNADYTTPYPGIPELLETLREKGVQLAVASNKYHKATEELILKYFPEIAFAAVFGQREGLPVKPHPAVVFEILDKVGVSAEETLYVGDSGVDMETAANSGVASVGVTWGFRPRSELEAAGACYIAETSLGVLELVDS